MQETFLSAESLTEHTSFTRSQIQLSCSDSSCVLSEEGLFGRDRGLSAENVFCKLEAGFLQRDFFWISFTSFQRPSVFSKVKEIYLFVTFPRVYILKISGRFGCLGSKMKCRG